jgi:RNA recognition motif-containing protein
MDTIMQVGNLASSVGDQDLLRLFELHGAVYSARVATHRGNGRSTGVGFVEMDNSAGGDAAIAALNGQEYRGRILVVCWSRTPCTAKSSHPRSRSGHRWGKSLPNRARCRQQAAWPDCW